MTLLSPPDISVHFITLGCAKNEVDTAHMRRALLEAGFSIVEDIDKAYVVVVNTCSFIQAATEESIETILECADLDGVKQGATKLIISGCMPSRYGEDLEKEFPEIDAFVSCAEEGSLVKVLGELFKVMPSEGGQASVGGNLEGSHPASAYVKISDGCDRFCSYCTIPFIRGKYHSFSLATIMEEVEDLIACGTKEIVLIAQDTGRWGTDLEEPSTLDRLLQTLARTFPATWFRVMYLQPEGITDTLLAVMREHENICNYVDIPLQHCNKEILTAMNRRGSAQEYKDLVQTIRSSIPGCIVRTTLIAGFPGETEEAFEELCDFVEQVEFDYVGVFPYSREEGTKAASLPGQIEAEEKLYRAQTLRDIADSIGAARVAAYIGTTQTVLVEGMEEDGQLYGRTQHQAPEVDGVVYVSEGQIGEFCTITLADALLYDLEGE